MCRFPKRFLPVRGFRSALRLLVGAITLCQASRDAIHAQATRADFDRALALPIEAQKWAGRSEIAPHWADDGNSFWYVRKQKNGPKQYVSVNALTGERRVLEGGGAVQLPQISPLGAGESRRSSRSGEHTELIFNNATPRTVSVEWMDLEGKAVRYFSLAAGEKRTQHTYVNHVWTVKPNEGSPLGFWRAEADGGVVQIRDVAGAQNPVKREPEAPLKDGAAAAPWTPFLRGHRVWIRHGSTGEEVPLSADGDESDSYTRVLPSPDGVHVAAIQVRKTPERVVHLVESSPGSQLQPLLHTVRYPKPGDEIPRARVRLFNVPRREAVPVEDGLWGNPWSIGQLHWAPEGTHFYFLYDERGHQVQRVLAVDAATGGVRVVVEERSETFVDYSQKTFLHWLDNTGELVWASERDGWNHLWLVDARTGAIKNRITSGPWVVRGVESVDSDAREIWFRCSGVYPDQDPYYLHLARVRLDGSGLTLLTASDGTHALRSTGDGARRLWQQSPDKRFFIVSHSRVDLPPVTELRRSADGGLVCVLEQTDISGLLSTGWRPPERFHAKGRDGLTEIYGTLVRPSHFDPAKKYPVIENIYAGPHGFFVPKEWNPGQSLRALAELGFIVVQIDGMGTNWRSKSFHDVAWKNLKDAGFPDRIAWIRAAASVHPELDLTRVGIYGGSAGGQNALAGLLHHGDFYSAAAADCGCHDNRMDKIWWNEAWMGWPVGAEYAENSNVTHASKLRGKLLLTVGELDRNVDPASTMQVVRALINANKDFELLVLPGAGHGAGEHPYAFRRRMAFFVRHLLGMEPRWD